MLGRVWLVGVMELRADACNPLLPPQHLLHEFGASVHEQHEGASGILQLYIRSLVFQPAHPSKLTPNHPSTAGVYKSELNRDNPLGMKGHVAEAFGQLLERLWSPTSSGAYAPREFKQALSKFAPSFSGYGQQDSQELLAFLLDGTHEDLNRIKKKPGTRSESVV